MIKTIQITPHKSLEQSLKQLLSTIRIRENDYIHQLQNLAQKEFKTTTTINLHNQKIQSDKFEQVLEAFGKTKGVLVNKFWEKLQSLYSISLERIELLGLNTPVIQEYYGQINKMLKEFKTDIHPLEDVGRIEYVIGKKSYYAILGRYRSDRKNIISRNQIDQEPTKIVQVKTQVTNKKTKQLRQKLKKNILIGYSSKSPKHKKREHFKGLDNYFDFRKSFKHLREKTKTSELAFEELLSRNSNIYKSISRQKHLHTAQTPLIQYFSDRLFYSQSSDRFQPEQSDHQLQFSPLFGKTTLKFKQKCHILRRQRQIVSIKQNK